MGRVILRLLLLLTLALTSCTGSSGPARRDPRDARLADLEVLVRAVEDHPEPFGTRDETRWRRDLAEVRGRVASLTDDEYLVALARLANLGDRNGHGGVFPTDQPALKMWPVLLYELADGWRVVAARDDALMGARVEAVGGRPVAQVARMLAPAVPHDNPHSLRARLGTYLATPAFLRGVGAYGPLRVVDRWGLRRDVTPAEVPAAEYAELARLDVPQIPPALPRPSWAPRDSWFWLVRRGGALVVGYERVASDAPDGGRVRALVAEVEAALRARPPAALVVDMRRNPGGDVGTAAPLRILLRDVARARRVPVRVLISRSTYSAAALACHELRREAPGVRFYGEPTGGGSVAFGDPNAETLPGTGIVVQVATARAAAPGRPVTAIVPDVRVEVTWDNWRAGRDEVLDAALRGT